MLNQKIKFMSIKWWFPGAEGVGKMGEKLVKGGMGWFLPVTAIELCFVLCLLLCLVAKLKLAE